MKYPIVIFEGDCDCLAYNDVKKAEAYHEPIDVKNNEYTGFDAEGRVLALKVEKNKTRIEDTLLVQPGILRNKLVSFIKSTKKTQPDQIDKLSLTELIWLADVKGTH